MSLITSLFGIFVFVQNVYAECTLNGEIVPCEDIPKWPFALMGLFFIVMMLFLVFWIWMLVDVIRNEKNNDLIMWLLILFFGSFLGAVIYYFVRKRGRVTQETNNTKTSVDVSN